MVSGGVISKKHRFQAAEALKLYNKDPRYLVQYLTRIGLSYEERGNILDQLIKLEIQRIDRGEPAPDPR